MSVQNYKTVITQEGLNILSQSITPGSQRYWVGYFALANVDETEKNNFDTSINSLVGDSNGGEYIYNVWQTVGNDIVANRFRYSTRDGKNHLVSWKYDTSTSAYLGVQIYSSTDAYKLPIPADLFYTEKSDSPSVPSYSSGELIGIPNDGNQPYVTIDTRSYIGNATSPQTNRPTKPAPLEYTAYHDSTVFTGSIYSNNIAKLFTVSNYNKYKIGEQESSTYQSASRSRKYFSASSINVVSSEDRRATQLKITFDLHIPEIENTTDAGTLNRVSNAYIGGDELFQRKYNDFYFNRIGMYAVPVKAYENGSAIVYEIDADAEPVLFMVTQSENPNYISEKGQGVYEFEFVVPLELAPSDSVLVTENITLFNKYESDSIKFYKNQMLMNAQLLNSMSKVQVAIEQLKMRTNKSSVLEESVQSSNFKILAGTGIQVDGDTSNGYTISTTLQSGMPLKEISLASTGQSIPALQAIGYDDVNDFGMVIKNVQVADGVHNIMLSNDELVEPIQGYLVNGQKTNFGGIVTHEVVELINTSTGIYTFNVDVPTRCLIHGFYWKNANAVSTANYIVTFKEASNTALLEAQMAHNASDCKSSGFNIEPMEFDSEFGTPYLQFGTGFNEVGTNVYVLISYVSKNVLNINYSI